MVLYEVRFYCIPANVHTKASHNRNGILPEWARTPHLGEREATGWADGASPGLGFPRPLGKYLPPARFWPTYGKLHTMDSNGNSPDKNKHGNPEENIRQYRANHGIVPGQSVPDEQIRDVENEELRDEDEPKDVVKEADITPEDLEALGPKDLNMDLGDDEDLKHRPHPVDFGGDDLDVPGVEDDNADEKIGSEDEENNLYSLGGDRHEDAEDENPDIVQ